VTECHFEKNRKKQVKTNKNRFFLVVMAKTLWTKKRFLFVFIGFYLFFLRPPKA